MSSANIKVVKNNEWMPASKDNPVPVLLYDANGIPLITADGGLKADVTDRAARVLGKVTAELTGRLTAIAGKKTVAIAGTPESLGNQVCGEGVYIVAAKTNTGAVYVFPAAGTKNDTIPLAPGDSDFWPVSNISALKVDTDISGEGIYWKGAV